MAEENLNDHHKDGKGVQAYRWAVMAALAVLAALSLRVLGQIDKTADLAFSLQAMVTALNSRLDAQAERIAGHDRRFERMEDRVYRGQP